MGFFDYDNKKPFYKQPWFIIGICVFVVIVIIVAVVLGIVLNKKKEGYEKSLTSNNNVVDINGHSIDCSTEVDYMKEFIKTSKGIS